MITSSEVWMNSKEVREYFNISINTLTSWIKQGRVPAPTQIGRGYKWTLGSIQIAEQRMIQRAMKGLRK